MTISLTTAVALILVVGTVTYYLGVSRGHLIADHEAGRDSYPVRFDAWEGEPEPDLDSRVACFAEGYRAGVRFEKFRAEQDAARSPGVRERMEAGAEGGRVVERGKVLG